MHNRTTRRTALLGSLAGAGVWLSAGATRSAHSPNERLNLALIGVGGRGAENLPEFVTENIVALCDVDERRAGEVYTQHAETPKFADYRVMLEKMDRQIDAVIISAPNHIHAPASALAMRMGKHCYCEKPLTHSVYEARQLAQLARENDVATQMGNQIHSSSNFRRVVELIRAGAIGEIRSVEIRHPRGMGGSDRPTAGPPIPASLDWDLFLGPAPYRPYHPSYVPHDWHYWWDFGGGTLGNFGCHYLDLAFWALDLKAPSTITATGPSPHMESTPAELSVRWQFSAQGQRPPVSVTWSHGDPRPRFWKEHSIPDWTWGVFVGTEGMLLANYLQHALWPEEKFESFAPPEPTIADSPGHHQEWILACKTGSPTTCHFGYSGPLTETVLLGNVAFRHGDTLEWDAESFRFVNAPAAERFLRREYRKGWEL